ncbi:MAG: rod shape-determining protein MreC [Bacteroides sp.]|nr:rod shape-determining protein MreC [Bacteroides sp.]
MRNLLRFLVRFSAWILFLIYVVASCWLLFTKNPYQHHVYLTSASALGRTVYGAANTVTSYFYLREINEDLQMRNTALEMEILHLKDQIAQYKLQEYADTMKIDSSLTRYSFALAHVINNSVNRTNNYITIDRGALDGIRPEMGVVDQNGVVGIVNIVGDHSARIISLLNPYLRISCKIKGQDVVGSLVWDGKNPMEAVLEELPRHAQFNLGDTVVTSGYSTVFPEGVPVGIVVERVTAPEENFRTLRVRLNTDFNTLSTVRIVLDSMSEEVKQVEDDSKTIPKTTLPSQ